MGCDDHDLLRVELEFEGDGAAHLANLGDFGFAERYAAIDFHVQVGSAEVEREILGERLQLLPPLAFGGPLAASFLEGDKVRALALHSRSHC